MRYSRFLRWSVEGLILLVVFALSVSIAAFACGVTGRVYTTSINENCPESSIILKFENNSITFSDFHIETIDTAGVGMCGQPTFSSEVTKCYPEFHTPTESACNLTTHPDCVRWSQLVYHKLVSCGYFSCGACELGTVLSFYIEYTCPPSPPPCGQPGDSCVPGSWLQRFL